MLLSVTIFILNFCCVMVSLLWHPIDVHSVNSTMTIHYWLWKWTPELSLWLRLVIRANLLWNGLKQWEASINAKATSSYWGGKPFVPLCSVPLYISINVYRHIHAYFLLQMCMHSTNAVQYKQKTILLKLWMHWSMIK